MFLHIRYSIMLKQETYNRGGCVLKDFLFENIQLNDIVYLVKAFKEVFLFLTSNEI